jgi:hypothetical protein
LIETLTEALTSHEYNDVTGTVTVNAVDGLFAIANGLAAMTCALNRIASVQERGLAEVAQNQQLETMLAHAALREPQ